MTLYNQKITKGKNTGFYKCILHYEGGPALETEEYTAWYYEGELHRDNGPAWVSKNGKDRRWYQKGKLHRIGGPAIDSPWLIVYAQNGLYHRDDGPAYIDVINNKQFFYQHGVELTEENRERVEKDANKR